MAAWGHWGSQEALRWETHPRRGHKMRPGGSRVAPIEAFIPMPGRGTVRGTWGTSALVVLGRAPVSVATIPAPVPIAAVAPIVAVVIVATELSVFGI